MNDFARPDRAGPLGEDQPALHANCQVFDVLSARYRHPVRKRERDFVVMTVPDWVNVIALTPDHQLVSCGSFVSASMISRWRFPRGYGGAAKNRWPRRSGELREETGQYR